MPAPLNFGANGSPFDDTRVGGYDTAPGADALDLTAFDKADGKTTIPPGVYTLRVKRGEVVTTKKGEPAYRVLFEVAEPTDRAGFGIWRYYMLTPNKVNETKNTLAPLGLRTAADLRAAFPGFRDVFVKGLVVIRPARDGYPESNDVQRFEPCPAPAGAVAAPNPFALPLTPPDATGEGVTK